MIDKTADHKSKRESPVGRWLPALFYLVNYIFWILTVVEFRAWNLFWLAVFPLPALIIYVALTRPRDEP